MKLYNTLTRQVDEIQPLQPPRVTVYTCGPTVYDYAHIGHWFNYVRMDTLIRSLKLSGLSPDWVMNITDVGHLVSDADDGEDKLEKGARREGKTAWEVAEFYTADFLECMKLLSITTPDHITKATDHIQEQIELIKVLEAKGYTYTISDGVYYDTSKFEGYAAFARLDLDGQQAGARVDFNSEKRNLSDFALWKFSPPTAEGGKKRDMEWDSPWGVGFPGWHIECSAMSMKYLGDSLDIHTGGIDHIPVHHTNEIAQSEAATGKRFANVWFHSNHLMVEGQKISKSLGNGIRLQSLLEQGFSPEAIRLYILESHYRHQSQFSAAGLQAANSRLINWRATAVLYWQPLVQSPDIQERTEVLQGSIDIAAQTVRASLQNDLDTPAALAAVDELFSELNAKLLPAELRQNFFEFLQLLDDAFGLQFTRLEDVTSDLKDVITRRQAARDDKDWALSDTLRDELADKGIEVRDTVHGPIWSYAK